MFNPIQMLTNKILKVIRKPRNPRPCNRKNIRKALLNLSVWNVSEETIINELNNLRECDRKIIYKELEKLSNIQLISIKSTITSKNNSNYDFIDISFAAMLGAFFSNVIPLLSMYLSSFIEIEIIRLMCSLNICFLVMMIVFYLNNSKNKYNNTNYNIIPILKTVIINFIDYILAKRNDDMQINEFKQIEKKKKVTRNKKK